MKGKEANLQMECVNWFRYQFPAYKMLLFAIPNGGKRNVVEAMNLKKQGVLAGVADLFLAVPSLNHHGFFIEMKAGQNEMTQTQQDFKRAVEKRGYKHEVVYSFDQFQREANFYIKQTHNGN